MREKSGGFFFKKSMPVCYMYGIFSCMNRLDYLSCHVGKYSMLHGAHSEGTPLWKALSDNGGAVQKLEGDMWVLLPPRFPSKK